MNSCCIHAVTCFIQADVFSFGIILCETIARTDADPDLLPRTHVRGLAMHHYITKSN